MSKEMLKMTEVNCRLRGKEGAERDQRHDPAGGVCVPDRFQRRGEIYAAQMCLRTASGREREILLCGRDNRVLKPKERARLAAVVPQSYGVEYAFTAEDVVAMGRYPYQGFGRHESGADEEEVRRAMEVTNTLEFQTGFTMS